MNVLPGDPSELARTLFADSADALFLFDADSELILHVNPAGLRLAGGAADEIVGQRIGALVRCEKNGAALEIREALAQSEASRDRACWILMRPRDAGLPVRVSITMIPSAARRIGLLRATVSDSVPEHGVTFDTFLPRCLPALEGAAQAGPPAVAAPTREAILIVDDEPMIRQIAHIILTRAGYEVLLAEDGQAGLEMVRAHLDRIALIVLDAIMPRLAGRETLRELARVAPGIRVLFSSGHSAEQMALHEFPQVRGFLSKPYRAEQLIQKVAEILGQARRESKHS